MAYIIQARQANPPPSIAAPDLKDLQQQLSAPPQQVPHTAGAISPGALPPGALPPGVMPPGAQQQDPRQALLAQLHDVEGYEPIGGWPPAPGWWLIAILLLASIIGTVTFFWRRIRNNRYRKQALKQLHKLREKPQANDVQAQALMQLLKRTFFTAYPQYRHRVAGIYGQQWLRILTSTSNKKFTKVLAHASANDFDSLLYGTSSSDDKNTLTLLFNMSEIWIKSHRSMSNKTDTLIAQVLNTYATTHTTMHTTKSSDQNPILSTKAAAHA